jgi:hypothetical protein
VSEWSLMDIAMVSCFYPKSALGHGQSHHRDLPEFRTSLIPPGGEKDAVLFKTSLLGYVYIHIHTHAYTHTHTHTQKRIKVQSQPA